MNNRAIALGLVVIVSIVFASLALMRTEYDIRIEVTGTGGVNLKGTCTANRESVNFNGPIPNTIRAKCRSFSYRFNNDTGSGSMTVKVYVNDELKGSITAEEENSVIEGTVKDGEVSQTAEPLAK